MDNTLVSVTFLSMAMAAGLSVVVWRMLRDERQRSEARVAALAGLTARQTVDRPEPDPLDLSIDTQSPAPVAPMFEERPQTSPWGNRLLVMGGIGLALAAVVLFALTANETKRAARAMAPQAAAAAATPAAGLELVSLRDARQDGSLTITGLVRNPQTATTLSRVAVTAYTFDEKGSFLASGRALLDVTTLAPGDESPFVVTVPVSDAVARYRIGFRGDDGRVIAHVDRRQQGPIAANW